HAGGAPSKLELLNEGSEPRIKLPSSVDGGEHKTTVSVSVRMGPQSALPTIDYALVWKAEGGKDAKAKDQASHGETHIVAKVAAATLPTTQPGAVPKELAGELGKMKGSTIQLGVGPGGALGQVKADLSKDARPELASFLDALVDALGTLWMPVPEKAVGAGA